MTSPETPTTEDAQELGVGTALRQLGDANFRLLFVSKLISAFGSAMAPVGAVSYGGLAVLAIADLIALTFTVFLAAIIIRVIISWISPGQYNPVIGLVDKIAEPVLRPIRKFLPAMGGIDLSPLFATLLLLVAKMLVVPPIIYFGSF